MSTNQKDDAVVAWVKTYCEKNPDSHVGRLFLYADPNAANLDHTKPETYNSLMLRCQQMNTVSVDKAVYDYEGTERPTSSVSISVRNRHVITQLLVLRSLVELMRLVHHVKSAKGEEWPVDAEGRALTSERFPAFKLPLLRSLMSSINKALVQELPTFIDDVYKAKYKNSGSYSYSLAETKFFTVRNRFLTESFNWISQLPEMQGVTMSGSDGRTIVDAYGNPVKFILSDSTGRVSRTNLAWTEWYEYTYSPKTQTPKFAQTYEKLASAYCARIGKLKYESQPVVDIRDASSLSESARKAKSEQEAAAALFRAQREAAELLMNALDFDRIEFFDNKKEFANFVTRPLDSNGKRLVNRDGLEVFHQPSHVMGIPDVKKKYFQTKLYEHLMVKLQTAHNNSAEAHGVSVPQDTKIAPSEAYKSTVISLMTNTLRSLDVYADAVGIEKSLVFLDMLETLVTKPMYTRADFDSIVYYFTQSGICNDRVMNSITKFISCSSQRTSPHSRKVIPLQIELAIVEDASSITKIKITESIDPAIIFSREAIQALSSQGETGAINAARFSGLVDKKSPGQATGYLQRGVMSLTSALKVEGDVYNPLTAASSGLTKVQADDQLRKFANELDEMANLFQGLIDPILSGRKKEQTAHNKLVNKYKKLTGMVIGSTGGSSPSMNQPFVSGSVSPSSYQGQGVFPGVQAQAVPFAPVSAPSAYYPAQAVAQPVQYQTAPAPAPEPLHAGHHQLHHVALDSIAPPSTAQVRSAHVSPNQSPSNRNAAPGVFGGVPAFGGAQPVTQSLFGASSPPQSQSNQQMDFFGTASPGKGGF